MSKRQVWVDVSSYRQGDKERIPTAWSLGEYPHELKVHRRIHETGWFVTCHPLGIDSERLGDISPDQAQKKAAAIISLRLAKVIAAYKKIGVEP